MTATYHVIIGFDRRSRPFAHTTSAQDSDHAIRQAIDTARLLGIQRAIKRIEVAPIQRDLGGV